MKAKITFLLCLCLVMSLCVMGHRQGIKHPTCEFCGLWKAKCPHNGNHPCEKCPQKFSTKKEMAAHKAKAHPAPTFNCNQCGQKFSTQALLNAHKAKAHPAPTFNCSQCGQKFNTQALLNTHKAKAHPAPTFNCNQCTQKFNTQAQLDAHIANVHTFNCDKCDQKFNTKAQLDAHIAKAHPQLYYDESSKCIVFGDIRYKMVEVSGGSFIMGANSDESYDVRKGEHRHGVTLSSYHIGQTEVTQALWQAVMGGNPSKFKGDNLPVEQVSWDDCQKFIDKLNSMTGQRFRFPTEAEWEFAARGGNKSQGFKYSGSNNLDDVAWYDKNNNGKTHSVALKLANELGIYDMSGSVYEWCSDWYDEYYYKNSSSSNPPGPSSGSHRVFRGGGGGSVAKHCRVSSRAYGSSNLVGSGIGLRLVLAPGPHFDCELCNQKFYTPGLLTAHFTKEHAPQPQELRTETLTVNGVSFKMCFVKGGSFLMGATPEQFHHDYDFSNPVHRVVLSDYYIGQTEVTQALWRAVMGNNPSKFKGDDFPVENVSWDDCQKFIGKLNAKTGREFCLPTEAEWEFAARGGNNSKGYRFSGSDKIDEVAWFGGDAGYGNSGQRSHSVGTKASNELGIYDMSGNVWEWCLDWHDLYSSSLQTNPTGARYGTYKVIRGGNWHYDSDFCQVSFRRVYKTSNYKDKGLGLRIALATK